MLASRAAVRATTGQVAGRRGFHATRARLSSPYHYPEGPYTNIPFDPKTKRFPFLFWGYCIAGFGAPFGIAGASSSSSLSLPWCPPRVEGPKKKINATTAADVLFCFDLQLGKSTGPSPRVCAGTPLVAAGRLGKSVVYGRFAVEAGWMASNGLADRIRQ